MYLNVKMFSLNPR